MNSSPAQPRPQLATLRGLLPFLRPYRARIALACTLLVLGSVTLLVLPLAFRDLVDFGFGSGAQLGAALDAHFLQLFALAMCWGLLVAARYYTVSWVGERVTVDLRTAVYARVLRQSPAFFETLRTGEVLSRLTGDTTLIQTVVGSSASMGLRSLLQFVGGMIMLAVTSFSLFALNLALMFGLALPIVFIGRKLKQLSRESQDRIADASALAGEMLNAMPTVQAFNQEASEAERFAARNETSFDTAIRRTRVRAALAALIITSVMGAIIFVLWIGAGQVASGSLSSGDLAAFVLYAGLVAGAAGTLAEVWGDIMRAAGAAGRLLELLYAESAIVEARPPAVPQQAAQTAIRFEQVSFAYPARPQILALSELDLDIKGGERVALVGPSGAGKTTLFQLLLRYYDLSAGTIFINGQDLRSLSLQDLRHDIAIVPQDPVIFSASALENIRYGRPDADDAAVHAAAAAAGADEFIRKLPDGYDTFLGERGTRLSGGQRQRIAIARAILKDARLLLLDEATSALDAESEVLVQQGLEMAMRGRTTLVIAHRLATVQQVDRIIVLDQGRIVETGTPADLRQQGGLYARLAALQLEQSTG